MSGGINDTLNELLHAERGSLFGHLAESQPFVPHSFAGSGPTVQRIIREEYRHQEQLVEELLARRGPIRMYPFAADVAGVHYLDLKFLMPRFISDLRRVIAAYESAGPRLAGDADAAALVSRMLEQKRSHLAELERIHGLVPARASA